MVAHLRGTPLLGGKRLPVHPAYFMPKARHLPKITTENLQISVNVTTLSMVAVVLASLQPPTKNEYYQKHTKQQKHVTWDFQGLLRRRWVMGAPASLPSWRTSSPADRRHSKGSPATWEQLRKNTRERKLRAPSQGLPLRKS